MTRGDRLPAVVVFHDGTDYWLADGFHRFEAAEILELSAIECTVIEGSLSDAVWFTCSANATNGQPRTQEDVRLAIERALKHPNAAEKTDREISVHVGCSHVTVASARARLEAVGQIDQQQTRIGKDGKRYKAHKPPKPAVEPVQLDIEDAIDAAMAAGGPKLVRIDQTWTFLMHATDAVRQAHRELPDPVTAAENLPISLCGTTIGHVRQPPATPAWRFLSPDKKVCFVT
jgi:hypothetical protein